MLTTTFLVLTLLGMLMGAFAAYLSQELLIDKIQKVVSQSCLELKDEPKELQTKAEDVLKKHLEEVVKVFKDQIPMVSLVLSQNREDNLKAMALAELSKAIPEIAANKENAKGLRNICSEELAKCFHAPRWPVIGIGALIGFIFGSLEFIILAFLHR